MYVCIASTKHIHAFICIQSIEFTKNVKCNDTIIFEGQYLQLRS